MTLEELLTLPLRKRIEWLRSTDGPRGKLSHDKLATKIGTTRQTVIGWEQGREPNPFYVEKLAEFSGFPASAFRRSEEERWPENLRLAIREELEAALEPVERLLQRLLDREPPESRAVGGGDR